MRQRNSLEGRQSIRLSDYAYPIFAMVLVAGLSILYLNTISTSNSFAKPNNSSLKYQYLVNHDNQLNKITIVASNSDLKDCEICLIDADGNCVKRDYVNIETSYKQFLVLDLDPGVYSVTISKEGESFIDQIEIR